jgi:hypothetical protein
MPARFREIAKALKRAGVAVVQRPGKGSHVVLRNASGSTYPLSLNNGDKTELSDVYIRSLCKRFGLDYDDFRKKL